MGWRIENSVREPRRGNVPDGTSWDALVQSIVALTSIDIASPSCATPPVPCDHCTFLNNPMRSRCEICDLQLNKPALTVAEELKHLVGRENARKLAFQRLLATANSTEADLTEWLNQMRARAGQDLSVGCNLACTRSDHSGPCLVCGQDQSKCFM
jgi:hypothetical protein